MFLIGNIIFDLIKDLNIRGTGGLTLGMTQWIEGNIHSGDRVVIVDDVITTGKSTIEALMRAKDAGLEIVK
jgi:orotate phosphoribosyltransferase